MSEKQEQPTQDPKEENKQTDESAEKIQPKKPRKSRPKFTANLLLDETNGLSALYRRVARFDPDIMTGSKENLQTLMNVYQKWLFQLYPADFNDMCWKISNYKGVRHNIQEFVFNIREASSSLKTNSEQPENQPKEEQSEENTQKSEQSNPIQISDEIRVPIEPSEPHEEIQPHILDFLGEEHD